MPFHSIRVHSATPQVISLTDLSTNRDHSRAEVVLYPYVRSHPAEDLAWIIHEPRLPQMQGAAYEDVVLHRECAATQQMR